MAEHPTSPSLFRDSAYSIEKVVGSYAKLLIFLYYLGCDSSFSTVPCRNQRTNHDNARVIHKCDVLG